MKFYVAYEVNDGTCYAPPHIVYLPRNLARGLCGAPTSAILRWELAGEMPPCEACVQKHNEILLTGDWNA